MSVACAAAESAGLPLYRYLGGVSAKILPVPMCIDEELGNTAVYDGRRAFAR